MVLHHDSSFAVFGPYGPPYGAQPATGGSPPGAYGQQPPGMFGQSNPASGMYGQQGSAPQSSSWLLRGRTGPSFAPPAPAEAAANWANHASLASAKAENVLMDIEKIRADAMQQVSKLSSEADQILAKVQSLSAKTVGDLQTESDKVILAYAAGKKAIDQMFLAAARDAKIVSKWPTSGASPKTIELPADASKSGISETGDKTAMADTSFALFRRRHHHPTTGDPEVDAALTLVRQQIALMKGQQGRHGHHHGGTVRHGGRGREGGTDGQGGTGRHGGTDREGGTGGKRHVNKHDRADEKERIAAKAASAVLLHDASNAINIALKNAKDLADKMNVREFESERQILEMLGRAQQSELKAAQIAGRAEIVAGRAVHYAQKMSHLAQYAQNAAGQAMAAQMAQAMGFPIAARGVPSPLPPPDVDAHIPATYVPGMPLQTMASYQQPGMMSRMFGRTGTSTFGNTNGYQPSYAGSGIPGNATQYGLGSMTVLLSLRETRMQNLSLFL